MTEANNTEKKKRGKAVVRFNVKKNDLIGKWQETPHGRPVTHAFFDMVRKFEEYMQKDWRGRPTGFTNLKDYLEQGGFDPNTFTISVKTKI